MHNFLNSLINSARFFLISLDITWGSETLHHSSSCDATFRSHAQVLLTAEAEPTFNLDTHEFNKKTKQNNIWPCFVEKKEINLF